MHGLVNRAIECFVSDAYSREMWLDVARRARLDEPSFESMLVYDDAITERLLAAAVLHLDKPEEAFLEDLGTYLVSHPTTAALRRLLRFGGETFIEFLESLDDLPGRTRLAVPDLDMPALELVDERDGRWRLSCRYRRPGFGPVLVGVLRAMADDYGALVLLELVEDEAEAEVIEITIHEAAFSEGRSFRLAEATL